MTRALDDPELGSVYKGALPRPPQKLPTFEEDPVGYAADLRQRMADAEAELLGINREQARIAMHCQHQRDGKWFLVPYQAGRNPYYEVNYVWCQVCGTVFVNAEAAKLGYIRPDHAPVAQLDPERRSTKPEATGSSPVGRTFLGIDWAYDRGERGHATTGFRLLYYKLEEAVFPPPQVAFQPPYQRRERIPSNSSHLPHSPRSRSSGYRGTRGR